MGCFVCENLERIFKAKQQEYIEACSAAYYRVSTKFAAYKNVDMERARNEFEEHQRICVSALSDSAFSAGRPTVPQTAIRSLWRAPSKRRPGHLIEVLADHEPSRVKADCGRQKPAYSS
ncbi:MAG: hypothetical protein ACLQLH_04545 [Terracidiphilus sp.]